MNRRELIKAMFAGTALAALPAKIQNACAEVVAKTPAKWNLNEWTHVQVTRTSNNFKLFINSERVQFEDSPFKITTHNSGVQVYDAAMKDTVLHTYGDIANSADFELQTWIKNSEEESAPALPDILEENHRMVEEYGPFYLNEVKKDSDTDIVLTWSSLPPDAKWWLE